MNLTFSPHRFLHATIDEVSFDAVQRIFERAYLDYRADPKYLMVSKENKVKLYYEVISERYITTQSWQQIRSKLGFPEKDLEGYPIPRDIYAVTNFTTGRMVPIVILPDLDDSMVILGFLEE